MGFLSSPAMIYGTMNHKGLLKKMVKEDMSSLFQPLLARGFSWDANMEKLVMPGIKEHRAMLFNTPWCHAKGTPRKHCGLDHQVTFNTWGVIPKRCLSCWKVTVTPNSFKQLMQLEVLQKNMDVPSKCGIELRDYTPKFYGGYFYNHSIDEGRERYEQVRNAVNNEIEGGKDISVILKRGCTEYEMVKGPSPFWHNTKEEEEFLELVEAFVEVPRGNARQSELVKTNVRLKWALWAHANGDFTYKELNNGESLFPDYVKYHEGDLDGIKTELAAAQASALEGIPNDVSFKFLKLAQWFAKKNEIEPSQIGSLFKGTEEVSLKNVPEQTKGEEDELT